MAGAYCQFCDRRCFVLRRMPTDARWRPGEDVHLATCREGANLDRTKTGYDHTTAINPRTIQVYACEPCTDAARATPAAVYDTHTDEVLCRGCAGDPDSPYSLEFILDHIPDRVDRTVPPRRTITIPA